MELNNFLEIIIEGSTKPQFFADHLYRKWKKAENLNYSIDEFIEGLYSANNFIKNKLEEQKRQELSLLYQYFIQEQEAGRQVENKKELIDEQNKIEYTFNPAHYGLNKYAGQLKGLNDVKFYNQKISEFSSKINNSRLTNKMNTEMNNKQEFDIPQFEADEIIKELTIEYYEEYFEEILTGELTLKNLVEDEIRMEEVNLEKSIQLGFGNEVRLFRHKINQLKKYYKMKNLDANDPSDPSIEQKPIEHIKWQKDSVLLAYLFNELKQKGFINDNRIWVKLSNFFVDKEGKKILNTTFPNLITSYGKTKTKHNNKSVPTEHKEISEIVSILVEVIKQTKN